MAAQSHNRGKRPFGRRIRNRHVYPWCLPSLLYQSHGSAPPESLNLEVDGCPRWDDIKTWETARAPPGAACIVANRSSTAPVKIDPGSIWPQLPIFHSFSAKLSACYPCSLHFSSPWNRPCYPITEGTTHHLTLGSEFHPECGHAHLPTVTLKAHGADRVIDRCATLGKANSELELHSGCARAALDHGSGGWPTQSC